MTHSKFFAYWGVGMFVFSMIFFRFGSGSAAETGGDAPDSVKPVSRSDVDWWTERVEANRQRLEQGDVELLFVGDSIVETLDAAGLGAWNYYNGDRHAMTMGFGGDRTEHVLWRLEHLPMDKIAPKAILLLIGSNNLYVTESDDDIALGVRACVEKLRALYPDAPILLVGVTPEKERPDEGVNARIPHLNTLIAQIAPTVPNVVYHEIGHLWCDEHGCSTLKMTRDHCHPNEEGCRLWLTDVEPILAEWLGVTPKQPPVPIP